MLDYCANVHYSSFSTSSATAASRNATDWRTRSCHSWSSVGANGSDANSSDYVGFIPPAPFPHELVVHRVSMIEHHSVVLTKGDANVSPDPWRLSIHDHFFSVVGHWNYLGTELDVLTRPAFLISLTLLVIGIKLWRSSASSTSR